MVNSIIKYFPHSIQISSLKNVLIECIKPNLRVKYILFSDVYGDFQCKKCGMKFAAKYYLTQHLQTNHNQVPDCYLILSNTTSTN